MKKSINLLAHTRKSRCTAEHVFLCRALAVYDLNTIHLFIMLHTFESGFTNTY